MNAIAAATGTAKTPKAVECEASQSGPSGIAKMTRTFLLFLILNEIRGIVCVALILRGWGWL